MVKLFLGALALVAGTASAATYQIDPNHSSVVFKVGHIGVSKVYGRFNDVSGRFTTDAAGELTGATVEVKAQSVDTGVARRDNHLRSADFFNAAQYPLIKFQSTGVTQLDGAKYELAGTLTLHGVSKTVTLEVEKIGQKRDAQGSDHVGAEGKLTIKRSDYGMSNLLDSAGDEVELMLAFEGIAD